MERGRLLVVFAAMLCCVGPVCGDLRTVFLAPVPVIFDFNVTVEAGTIADQRREVAKTLIEQCDEDGDGHLSIEEASTLNPLPGDRNMTVKGLWKTVDVDPADDKLNEDEVHRLIDEAVGPEIVLERVEGRSLNDLALEAYLDANKDGQIESSEYAAGFQTLFRVDFDDDDTLSAAELIAFAKATEAAEERPMPLSVGDNPTLAKQLAKLSGDPSAQSWHERRWAEIDGDDDGTVTAEEVRAWIEEAKADLWIRLDVSRQFGNRIKLEMGESRLKPARPVKTRRSRSTVQASVGGRPNVVDVEFRVPKNFTEADSRAFLKLQHIKADDDQNGYLTKGEYGGGFDNKPGTFEELDRNGDGMLFSDELEWFIDSKQNLAKLQVKLSVENVSKSLFDQIDQDIDNRLAPREIVRLSGGDRPADMTQSAWRIYARADEIQFVQGEMQSVAERQLARPRDQTRGPNWFIKMDRNKDGDLTWREFLGPRESFDKLDRNGDGFVTVEEADQM